MIDSKVLNSPIRWAGSKKKILNEMLNAFKPGKYKQKWVSTKLKVKGNKYKAMDFLNKLITEYEEKEAATEPSDTLFTNYLIQWLEKKKIRSKR